MKDFDPEFKKAFPSIPEIEVEELEFDIPKIEVADLPTATITE